MEINFKEYLSEDEIKEIVIDEFRSQLQAVFKQEKELERVMGNLAYHIIQEELEKITPNYATYLEKKVNKILREESSLKYMIFKNHYLTEEPQSFASKLVQQTVKDNQELIKEKVINTIKESDYSSEIAKVLENSVDNLASDIYKISELLLTKK